MGSSARTCMHTCLCIFCFYSYTREAKERPMHVSGCFVFDLSWPCLSVCVCFLAVSNPGHWWPRTCNSPGPG